MDEIDFTINAPELSGKPAVFEQDIIGDLELTVYQPREMYTTNYERRYAFIKNLTLKCQKPDTTQADNATKKDTTYTNVISDQYLNELDDIKLYITSTNKSGLAYSKVMDSSTNSLIDTVTSYYNSSALKPEQLIINKVVNQYQKTKTKIEEVTIPTLQPYELVQIKSQGTKNFLLTAEEIDLKYASSKITMVEVI